MRLELEIKVDFSLDGVVIIENKYIGKYVNDGYKILASFTANAALTGARDLFCKDAAPVITMHVLKKP